MSRRRARRASQRPGWLARAAAAVVLCLQLNPTIALSQDDPEPPIFRSLVEMVQLQLTVTDRQKDFVHGLSPDDFVLTIDGDERSLSTLYEVDLTGALEAGPTAESARLTAGSVPIVRAAPLPVAVRRHFLFLFDLRFSDWVGTRLARDATAEFVLGSGHPSDLFAVATITTSGVSLVQPFSSDRELVHWTLTSAIKGFDVDRVGPAGSTFRDLLAEAPSGRGRSEVDEMLRVVQGLALSADQEAYGSAVSGYLAAIAELAESLRAIRGRKQVVLFSAGFEDMALFGEMGSATGGDLPSRVDLLTRAAGLFNSADALVHSVSTQRLRNYRSVDLDYFEPADGRPQPRLATRDDDQFLTALADSTGGSWHSNQTDFRRPLVAIDRATRQYYVATYRRMPSDLPSVRVDVRLRDESRGSVAHPERASAEPSFSEMTPVQRALQLGEVLAEPPAPNDSLLIGIDRTAGGGRATLTVPRPTIDRLARAGGDADIEIELGIFATSSTGSIGEVVRRAIRIDATVHEHGLWIGEILELPPGGSVRAVIREPGAGVPMQVGTMLAAAPPAVSAAALDGPLIVGAYDLGLSGEPRISAGTSVRLWFAASGLVADAWGLGQFAIRAELEHPGGTSRSLGVGFVDSRDRPGKQDRWVEAVIPPDATLGAARMHVWLRDSVSGSILHGSTVLEVGVPER